MHAFAAMAGPEGRYVAVEVDPRNIDFLEYRIAVEDPTFHDRKRIVLIEDQWLNPCLPEGFADLVFVEDMHWLIVSAPPTRDDGKPMEPDEALQTVRSFWAHVRSGMVPGGRLIIHESFDTSSPPLSLEVFCASLEAVGFKRVTVEHEADSHASWLVYTAA